MCGTNPDGSRRKVDSRLGLLGLLGGFGNPRFQALQNRLTPDKDVLETAREVRRDFEGGGTTTTPKQQTPPPRQATSGGSTGLSIRTGSRTRVATRKKATARQSRIKRFTTIGDY